MQKEQLTTQLIGAIVFHTEFGQGIIVKAEAKDDNVIIDIQFAQNKKSYAAFIAIEKGVVSFVDNQYYLIVDNLKTIYDEEKKHKEIKSEVKIGSKNNDIILLTELLKAGKSITHKLIGLYNNVEFEADLFACGSELFFKKMNGCYLSNDDLYVIILYLSYIALIEYDGEFHGKVVESLSLLAKRSIDSNTVRNTIYGVIEQLKVREKVQYFNPSSYVAVPISIACVPHYRIGQLFRVAYDIYKKKLLFNEDVTDQQISEKVSEALSTLKRRNYISKTSEDVIKGTEYLMSKYTQSCIWSGYNLDALIGIITYSIRLIINYLTKQEDAYIVLDFYKEGFSKWIDNFESDGAEREAYLFNKSLSSPSFIMGSEYQIYLKTGAYCMDDTYNPHNVTIYLYNGEELIHKYKLDGANDIEYNNEAIGGYKINSQKFILPPNCSPIDKLKYQICCDNKILYDSQEKLYRDALFFCANDGVEAKPGSDHIGDVLIVVSKTKNSDTYGDKIITIASRENFVISQIIIENGDSYLIDGNPYVFRKIKEVEHFGYKVPWIKFLSMEKRLYPIFKNSSFLITTSCDKEDVQVLLDGNVLNFYNRDYRIYRYSQNSDRTFVYLVKVFCAASGYHQIEFQNSVTNKQIGKKKLTFIVDEDLHKENQEFTVNGQTFELVSSFLHNPESISYPFGESLVKIDAYVTNIGHGELYLLPSAPCYSLDEKSWMDLYQPLCLYDIPSEQRHIHICGPERMSIYYASDKGKRNHLDFEQVTNNTYKIPLSFIRSIDDRKGNICFEYGNTCKLLRVFRLPFIRSINCVPSNDETCYEISIDTTAKTGLWLVVKTSANESPLLEKEIYSKGVIKLDKKLVAPNMRYISLEVHTQGTSLFNRYNPTPFHVSQYTIPCDITINDNTVFYYNIEKRFIKAKVSFTGETQIKVRVFPTGIDMLLFEQIVKNNEEFSINVDHGLFSSYCVLFESLSETSKRINKPKHIVKAKSIYLFKPFDVEQFIMEDGIVKNMSGIQFVFGDRYLLIDKIIYAVGEIKNKKNFQESYLTLLKMSLSPVEDGIFEVYKIKDCNTSISELKRFRFKSGAKLEKIKLKMREEQ